MVLAQGAALPVMPWRLGHVRRRVKVAFLLGEQRAAERVSQRLFGRVLQPHEYADLAGASDDANVEVGASDGKLYIELRDPVNAIAGYYYLYRKNTAVVFLNDGFQVQVSSMQRQGLGLQMFCRQVHSTTVLGIDRIDTVAGRNDDENGYYTWPRYGFDGVLPASVRRLLPAELNHSHTVLDVMASEQGRTWWREHGVTISVRFDLAPGSRSRHVLVQYVRERKSASGTKRNLEDARAMRYGSAR